ncbi:MAG: DUF3019 domain-containing protein [Gammaproteobacteria bacterium]|nr:DUF3019 domain-containing protein [Gammaproteobacteria bacterium]
MRTFRPAVPCLTLCAVLAGAAPAGAAEPGRIQLDVTPRLCTLTAEDVSCDTVVKAEWRSPQNESLCLLIAGRPEIRQCWENHAQGRYSLALVFSEDLILELRQLQNQELVASQAIRVIREALQLRRKRRPPWGIFN